jgi:hypothetical protein
MAAVATIKPAEDRRAPEAYSIALIPLNKLVPWDGNVRRTNAKAGLGELCLASRSRYHLLDKRELVT